MAVLRADDLWFSYGKNHVLEGVNLEVASGERVALRAPSGRGKTTLCQLLAGYLMPDRGSVTLDGASVGPARGKPNPVQLIWQHPEQAVDPYLRLGRTLAEAGEVPTDLLGELGIREEWLGKFPHELSGGELQRCCIARVLATHPRFIIADEATTMLDAITQVQIWDALLSYCAHHDAGMALVTHSEPLTKRLATRIVEI